MLEKWDRCEKTNVFLKVDSFVFAPYAATKSLHHRIKKGDPQRESNKEPPAVM